MPIQRIRRKIHHLRGQSEEVRLRVATYVTIVGGVFLTILWVTVLLPLQLRLSGGLNKSEPSYDISSQIISREDDAGRVGGVRDDVSTPSTQLFYTAPPQVNSGGTVINNSDTVPVTSTVTGSSNNTGPEDPQGDPDTVSVEVTE